MNLPANTTANSSYVRAFSNYTTLKFTPELAFYTKMAALNSLNITADNVTDFLKPTGIYNLKVYSDVLLGNLTIDDPWNTDTMKRYLRFVVVEGALQGLFQYKTPRQYMEGFNDTLILQMSAAPVYMGGDATNPAFMTTNAPPTIMRTQNLSYFSGDDDYMSTRRIAKWNNDSFVTVLRKDYDDIATVSSQFINPWDTQINLDGTDGMQFHPLVEETETLSAFTNEISRHGYFDFKTSNTDDYDGLTLMTF
jgi:hypothetical protein